MYRPRCYLELFHRTAQVDHALRAQRVERDGGAQGLVELDGGRRMEDDRHLGAKRPPVLGAQTQIGIGHIATDAHHFGERLFRIHFRPDAVEHLRVEGKKK